MASLRAVESAEPEQERAAKQAPEAAAAPTVANVLSLQRSIGNRAVAQLLQRWDTKPYELSKSPVTIVKGADPEAPYDYCNQVVTDAGLDPTDWFSNFTDFTFLGHGLGEPIHTDLADHLKTIEQKFADQYGGPDKKPAVAAKNLGITSVGGSRKSPTSAAISMHLFGLAIDVNYTANPFIGASANEVFARAGKLIGESDVAYKDGMSFEQLARVNNVIMAYFAFLDAKDEELEKYLKDNENAPWKGKSAADAKTQIQKDLDTVAGKWERSKDAQKAVIKKSGFMDLDKRFIDGIGLSWGASYGDIMHFDLRNKGNGKKINAAGQAYKKKKQAEAAAKKKEAAEKKKAAAAG